MDEQEIEVAFDVLRERGLVPTGGSADTDAVAIDAADYPELAAIWDNDDDAIFDEL